MEVHHLAAAAAAAQGFPWANGAGLDTAGEAHRERQQCKVRGNECCSQHCLPTVRPQQCQGLSGQMCRLSFTCRTLPAKFHTRLIQLRSSLSDGTGKFQIYFLIFFISTEHQTIQNIRVKTLQVLHRSGFFGAPCVWFTPHLCYLILTGKKIICIFFSFSVTAAVQRQDERTKEALIAALIIPSHFKLRWREGI